MTQTYLSQAVDAANDAVTYDTNVKFLLADRQILARILKYAVSEFQDMAIDEIMSCIGNDIEIGSKPLDAGLSNLGRIKDSNIEDNVPGEGIIFYDIRFTAYLRQSEMKILINVEAQKSSDPSALGYHLENRIIFYMARMVSAQKQTEFFHSNYDNLKKVRSIWICMDSSDEGDSIEELGFEKKSIFGNKTNLHNTDLMKGIIINIRSGENLKDSQNILINMLEKLFSQMDTAEKKRILTESYGMIMTADLEGRIQTMCNLSENIEAKGIEKGIEQGIEEERTNAIKRMLKAGATKEQILSYGYTEKELTEISQNFNVSVDFSTPSIV
jgi:predicted transposase/invertase (TIGR01784 family)